MPYTIHRLEWFLCSWATGNCPAYPCVKTVLHTHLQHISVHSKLLIII